MLRVAERSLLQLVAETSVNWSSATSVERTSIAEGSLGSSAVQGVGWGEDLKAGKKR
jgi:hypothetical protein